MRAYIIQRLLIGVLTVVGMSIVIFVLMRIAPGNIVDIIFQSAGYVNPAAKEEIMQEMGLDRPIIVQYVSWLGQLVQGDLGKSYRYDIPAWELIEPRIPVTVQLAIMALLVSVCIGIPAGVVSAVRQDTWLDYAFRVFSLAGLSMPSFWLGMLIILILVQSFGWIPSMLYISPWEDWRGNLRQFMFPALAVGYLSSALIMRITRSALLEVLREDYIRTAWAKGLRERQVVYQHALKNSILSVITVIGIEFAFLIGGLIVTETVFNLPGVARFLVEANPERILREASGTGPYKFVNFTKGDKMTLTVNPEWWGDRRQLPVKDVVFLFHPEDGVRLAALKAGEADLAHNIGADLAKLAPKFVHKGALEVFLLRLN